MQLPFILKSASCVVSMDDKSYANLMKHVRKPGDNRPAHYFNQDELLALARQNEKRAAVDGIEEPTQVMHSHSPAELLRPRSEVIIFNKDGVLAIKKPTYLLMPGGGIPDGETPESSAIRESLEEADAIIKNVEKQAVVDTVYDRDNIIIEGWDGEQTHFYLALYGGEGRTNHPDKENFKFIPFGEAIEFLNTLISDPAQSWAKENNLHRKEIIMKAKRLSGISSTFNFKKYASCPVVIKQAANLRQLADMGKRRKHKAKPYMHGTTVQSNQGQVGKTAAPYILKQAVSPMAIMRAGMNRLNDISRQSIAIAKARPSSEAEAAKIFADKANLLKKLDRTALQIGGMNMFHRDTKAKGIEYGQVKELLLNRLKSVSSGVRRSGFTPIKH